MKKLMISVLWVALAGCGTFQQTKQSESGSFLLLRGDSYHKILQIDEQSPIVIGKETHGFVLDGERVTKIAVTPGKHRVTISTTDGKIGVDRSIYVSEGNTFEIQVP
jgi:hypothetical protein